MSPYLQIAAPTARYAAQRPLTEKLLELSGFKCQINGEKCYKVLKRHLPRLLPYRAPAIGFTLDFTALTKTGFIY